MKFTYIGSCYLASALGNQPWGGFTLLPNNGWYDVLMIGRHVDSSPVWRMALPPLATWSKNPRASLTDLWLPEVFYGKALPQGVGANACYVNGLRAIGRRVYWTFIRWYDVSPGIRPTLGYTDAKADGTFSPVGPFTASVDGHQTNAYLLDLPTGLGLGCGMAQNGSGASSWGESLFTVPKPDGPPSGILTATELLSFSSTNRAPMPANYYSLGVFNDAGKQLQPTREGCHAPINGVGSWKSTDHCFAAEWINDCLVCFTSNAQGADWYGPSPLTYPGNPSAWKLGQVYTDPANKAKGDHASAYAPLVRIYPAVDFGQPSPQPATTFDLRSLGSFQLGPQCLITGAHFIKESRTLILSAYNAETDAKGSRPVLHGFSVV